MKTLAFLTSLLALFSLTLSGCESPAIFGESLPAEGTAATSDHSPTDPAPRAERKIVVTHPLRRDVVNTQQFVCQIHSCKHIEVRSLEGGYLEEIRVNEGQAVHKGDLLFKIVPTLYQSKLDGEIAEAARIEIELKNAEALLNKNIVSAQEIALKKAELAKAQAQVNLARAELNFANIVAPFDGIVDHQHLQLGSLISEGDVLTTLSDNSLMWVYFNVPERWYLEYKSDLERNGGNDHLQIELKLANGEIFPFPGKIGAIEADFDNTTGNIQFRADFPNPQGLLRNGQTGTVLIHRELPNVLVIPQRCKYEILAQQYVYVVDDQNVVHQRDIAVQAVQDDIFVIGSGLEPTDKVILEGIRQVRDGEKVEYELKEPAEILANLKFHAE